MCLISACPKGTIKYNKDIEGFVVQGMKTNRDGSGFMYKKHGSKEVGLHKGFRTANELLSALEALKLTLKDELVIHHRIGTSGEPNEINMHPFLISDNNTVLQHIKGTFNVPAMAHNGIFNLYGDWNSPYNDTYHFVREFMSIPEFLTLLKRDSRKFQECFRSTISYNKLAFLFPDRDIILVGNFEEDNGYYHSNGGYKEPVFDKGGSSFNKHNKSNKGSEANLTGQNCRISQQLVLAGPKNLEFPFQGGEEILDEDDRYASIVQEGIDDAAIARTFEKGKIISIDSTNNKLPAKFAGKERNIKFSPTDIRITRNNYKHFLLAPVTNYNSAITKDECYKLEEYDPSVVCNFVCALSNPSVIHAAVDTEKLFRMCVFYVRSEYFALYVGMEKLVLETKGNPSVTMLKKIAKAMNKKVHKKDVKFKKYGSIQWDDLFHFYENHKYKLEPADKNLAVKGDDIDEDALDRFLNNKEAVLTNAEIVEDTTS